MLLEARSEFSPSGTLFVLALMFLPLLFAWAASVYENRLSVYFSEQVGEPLNIEKKHIILGVIFSYSVPLFALSFGLLGLYQFTGDMGTEVVEGMPVHSTIKLLLFLAFTLISSLIGAVAYKRMLYRKHMREESYVEARPYFIRWVDRVNLVSAALTVGMYWVALWLFPELAMKTLN
jgi:hypothetical protein